MRLIELDLTIRSLVWHICLGPYNAIDRDLALVLLIQRATATIYSVRLQVFWNPVRSCPKRMTETKGIPKSRTFFSNPSRWIGPVGEFAYPCSAGTIG